ncbi:hypothetical protein M9Y10_019386 [Tritrichomonas musculus]|uniref:Calpain catalytic domain-containing protein n=1 Tax=Tritrichomonas musculus TaxID=1915356 RepID=A0ABR2HK37_9EUKA
MKSFDDFANEASKYKQILINYREKGQVFTDSFFHPNKNIQEKDVTFSNDKHKWMRFDEIFKAPLFKKELIKPEFILKGDYSDSTLLSAFTQIAKQPETVHSFFDIELVESILGKENDSLNLKCGAVVINLYAFGRKIPVLIDTLIPFYKGKRRSLFCRPIDISKSAWFSLIEKAMAKLFGSFTNLRKICYDDIVYTLFNYYTDQILLTKIEGDGFAQMLKYQDDMILMSVISYSSEPLNVSHEEFVSKGLEHCFYPILKVQKCQGKNFVCLRSNRSIENEWLGDYSDNSSLWTPQLRKELGAKASNDGIFWMIDKDLFKYFNYLKLSEPIQKNWIVRQFTYRFTPGAHDGQPFTSPAAKVSERPNYALQITDPIKPGNECIIRILIEKRNLTGPNIKTKYVILFGKHKGRKLTPDIINYTYRYTLTSEIFSFTYPVEKTDQIITIAMHRLSKSEMTEECYVRIICDHDFKLYNIDKPGQSIPKSENYDLIFQVSNEQPKKEIKVISPPKIVENEVNEKTENEKEIDNFKIIKNRADKGDVDAMFECSELLKYGDGVDVNMNESIKYCKMAADKGSIKAMFRYASNCEVGDGIPTNKKEALKYYKMAANKGNLKSMVRIAEMLSNGDGVDVNNELAVKFYKMAANRGDSLSMFNCAVILSNGDGVPQNKAEAAIYYKMAADKGDVDAMFRYAEIIEKGDENVDANPEEAAKYYKMAADKGDVESMISYASMLDDGEGIDENKKEAAKYYSKAADEGDVQSMFFAATIYDDEDNGFGVDLRKSAKYYKMAADRGDKESMYFYGLKLLDGEGVDIDEEEGYKYIKKSADLGYDRAINYLNK